MKRIKVFIVAALAVVLTAGCSQREERKPIALTEAVTEAPQENVQAETENETKAQTKAVEDSKHSYLTGKLTDPSIGRKRPLAIMINNIQAAIPQYGISQADVIYESLVEGSITRLMAIFEDYSNLEKIGPVRSCRDYYIDFAMEFDGIYTHFGQAVYAVEKLNSEEVNNISGLEYQEGAGKLWGYAGENTFYRTSDRKAPHNCYTSAEGLKKAIEKLCYDTEYDENYKGHYLFAADGETVTYTDGSATHIEPGYDYNDASFEYNSEDGLYYRSQYSGAHIDEMTGNQLNFTNVIFQSCNWENYDNHGYLKIDTQSGGEAWVFTQGTYQKGTWKKDSIYSPAHYYDADGREITINQGKTWVCILKNTELDKVVVQ